LIPAAAKIEGRRTEESKAATAGVQAAIHYSSELIEIEFLGSSTTF